MGNWFTVKEWRKFETGGGWSKEYETKLKQDIKAFEHPNGLRFARIALFGPLGAGKSSFINSVGSIDHGYPGSFAVFASATGSVTRTLRQYKPVTLSNNFVLLDTKGIYELDGIGLNMGDIVSILAGKVPLNYQFDSNAPIVPDDERSSIDNMVHCIAVVVDGLQVDTDGYSNAFKTKFALLLRHAYDQDVRVVVLLTKIDEVCKEIKEDITNIYRNNKMATIIIKARDLFGIPVMNIFPIQNYSSEEELNPNMNILLLLALRQMVRLASNRIKSLKDQEEYHE